MMVGPFVSLNRESWPLLPAPLPPVPTTIWYVLVPVTAMLRAGREVGHGRNSQGGKDGQKSLMGGAEWANRMDQLELVLWPHCKTHSVSFIHSLM
jgi:hypothetical protein